MDVSGVSQGADGGSAGRARRRSRGLAVRACRRTLLGGAVAFAFVGALTSPAHVVLLVAPGFGFFVAGMVASVNPAFPGDRSARRAAVLSGSGAALVVPCLAGIGQFGAPGSVAAVVLMVLGCVVVGRWIAEQSDPPHRLAAPDLDVEELRQFLQVLPTSLLLREWRSTGEHVQPGADPDLRAGAVLVRTLFLEELSLRDPVGVGRWLSGGDEDAPEEYLRGDSDATT